MQLSVDAQITQAFPEFRIGVVVLHSALNIFDPTIHRELLTAASDPLRRMHPSPLHEIRDLDNRPEIEAWREAYRLFGINPRRMRPSSEALVRRVLQGRSLPLINPLVNISMQISVEMLTPVGGYDLRHVDGNILLRSSSGDEPFISTSGDSDATERNEVVYADAGGVLTRCWNHRDGDRTKITEDSTDVVLCCESPGLGFPPDVIDRTANALGERCRELLGCSASVVVVDANDRVRDLGEARCGAQVKEERSAL